MTLAKRYSIALILTFLVSYAQDSQDNFTLPTPLQFYGHLKTGMQNYVYREPSVMSIEGPMFVVDAMFGLKPSSFTASDIEVYYVTDIGQNIYDGAIVKMFSDGRQEISPIKARSSDYYFGGIYRAGITPINDEFGNEFMIYVGLAYRYLNNQVHSVGAYQREQHYLYLPLGIRTQIKINKFIGIKGTLEFRPLILGRNKSHFKMIGHDNDLIFSQRNGVGLEASVGIEFFIAKKSSIFLEGFFDYWNIADSTKVDSYIDGLHVGTYIEPKNTTSLYGIRIGYSF